MFEDEPTLRIRFNANMSPEQLRDALFFRSSAGTRVGAHTIVAEEKWEHRTWREIFYANAADPAPPSGASVFTVTPRKPLPAEAGWRLVLPKGLAASTPELTLPGEAVVDVGDIRTFEVAEVKVQNLFRSGCSMDVLFTRQLQRDLTPERLQELIRVEPVPEDFEIDAYGSEVSLRGKFSREQPVTLRISADLPASPRTRLGRAFEQKIVFPPVAPRVYFPSFVRAQHSAGRLLHPIHCVNVPGIRVRVKKIEPDQAVAALQLYSKYRKDWDAENVEMEPFQGVGFDAIPGDLIYSQSHPLPNRPDQEETFELDWREVLQGRTHGLFFVMAEQENGLIQQGTQAIIQLTNVGGIWKMGTDRTLFYCFSTETGQPLHSARISVISADGNVAADAECNDHGLAYGPAFSGLADPEWLRFQHGTDVVFVPLKSQDGAVLYPDAFGAIWGEQDSGVRTMVFSDRPLYRPGETVQLKGILRDIRAAQLAMPQQAQWQLRLIADDDSVLHESSVVMSDMGSFAHSFTLEKNVRTGGIHAVMLRDAGTEQAFEHHLGQLFRIEEFEPNAFQVKLSEPSTDNNRVSTTLASNYFMGVPLSQARVRWGITRKLTQILMPQWPSHAFGTIVYEGDTSQLSESVTGEDTVGSDGTLRIAGKLAPVEQQGIASIRIEAAVTDANQQTVTEWITAVQHLSDFYVGASLADSFVRTNEPLALDLIAVDHAGEPIAETVPVKARLFAVRHRTVLAEGAGGAMLYVNDTAREEVAEAEFTVPKASREGGKWKSARMETRLVPPEPGQYDIELTADDAQGRKVRTHLTIYVSGDEPVVWEYGNAARIELVPDADRYAAGDTARVLVKTPFAGKALITVERAGILSSRIEELAGNAPIVEIPLAEFSPPDVSVGVILLRGLAQSERVYKTPDFRMGYVTLKIEDPRTKLQIDVQPGSAVAEPGSKARVVATVRDGNEEAVKDAEVTLYAVDEGILAIMGTPTPDPFSIFHAPMGASIGTGLSLPLMLPENPQFLDFENKGFLIGGGGKGLFPGNLRKLFQPTPLWQSALRTDAQGQVQAEFLVPDALTRYRLIAVAHTARQAFGHGESSIEVKRPFMVQSALPPHANQGDTLLCRAVVHNQTQEDGAINIRLAISGGAVAEKTDFARSLRAGESATIEVPVSFPELAQQTVAWSGELTTASGASHTDGMQVQLPVFPVVPRLREVHLDYHEKGERNLFAAVNPAILENQGSATVRISNSRRLQIAEAITQLLHYPYGCAEQTASALLPWLLAPEGRDRAGERIAAGVDKLLASQRADGGIAYWPSSRSSEPWTSAYVALVLTFAREQGHAVPTLESLYDYLSSILREASKVPDSARCLALYALAKAGKSEPAYHEVLLAKRSKLDAESRRFLALAILEGGGDQQMVQPLLAATDVAYADYGGPERMAALQVLLACRDATAQPLEREMEKLLAARQGGHWRTTQGNAWAVFAFDAYLRLRETSASAASATLRRADYQEVLSFDETPSEQTREFMLPGKGRSAPLVLHNEGPGALISMVTAEAQPDVGAMPRQDRGFGIARRLQRMGADGELLPVEGSKVGDTIVVTLEISAHKESRFVAINDALPAQLEGINAAFRTSGNTDAANDDFSDHREIRTGRMLFFADHVPAGHYSIQYLTRVRAAGTSTAPPAKVEAMYDPERFGLSETQSLVIEP